MMNLQAILNRRFANKIVLYLIVAIFIILPFTTLITVFVGTKLNHLTLFKVWKELAMVVVVGLVLLSGTVRHLGSIKEHLVKILFWLIVAYSVWAVSLGLINLLILENINWEAFLYALIVDLRFLFFFILCWLVSQDSPLLKANWRVLLLAPATVVVTFGVLQAFLLPAGFLEHFGYGKDTITAYQLVDQKPDYVRIQSTLRGPNPFGVYLILIISALVIGFGKKRLQQLLLMGASLISLFYSYSRSAWLGAMAALGALCFVSIPSGRIRKLILISGAVFLLFGVSGIYLARNNSFVQNTIFHTDTTSRSPESSNEGRARAIQQGLDDLATEPFGQGPGSAGPASLRNDGHAERIAENYYLQIGQELGWIGLLLFLTINGLVVFLLWQQRQSVLTKVLLASFVGITVANMVSHAWTDDTIALLWWGLAGIALAPHLAKNKPIAQVSNIDNKPFKH